MPHLSPMPWMNFIFSMWILLIVLSSNTWWFMNKPMKQTNKKLSNPEMTSWKW
uniref:ATP synthase F0 subunit 8 n=1 Tax=Helobdella europaea TaxID=270691 RepID=UPI0023F0CA91|nr:ATP synthase F0 subunit 8 [Helobdella europaea]WDY83674.1 ATP synthase F0 subunit 8 [Helobdella europaea]